MTHFDFSTYSAFDNNPVYFADPSGADSWGYEYDYEYEYDYREDIDPTRPGKYEGERWYDEETGNPRCRTNPFVW